MTIVTVEGNTTDAPTLGYTSTGTAYASVTVALNDRRFDRASGEWVARPPVFHRVVAFGCVVMDWRHHARCAGLDPELFFPLGGPDAGAAAQTARAKSVCGGCPVRQDCLDWAMATGQDDGVGGGLDEHERRELRRATARPRRRRDLIPTRAPAASRGPRRSA